MIKHRMKVIFNSALYIICFTLVILVLVVMFKYATTDPIQPASAIHKDVYMICDVYDVTYNGNNVDIDIVLPNGELLTRQLSVDDDLPESFYEVVIQTSDLDDYSTYNIVGMR